MYGSIIKFLKCIKNRVFGIFHIFSICRKFCDTYYENPPVYLSITAIIYNEAQYLKEWIEYHNMLGVERFYLYDNGSTDNTKEILKSYIESGLVMYHYVPEKYIQNKVYSDAIAKYKNQTRWMAIIDLDEFIVPIEKNNIADFLKDYEKYPGVCINWEIFDSNGHNTPPKENNGLVIANYTKTSKDKSYLPNRHIKSIINPRKVYKVVNPHLCLYLFNQFAVDENFEAVKEPIAEKHSALKIRINHYFTKSKSEYLDKLKKGCADAQREKVIFENAINFSDWQYDYVIQKYLPQLKKRMEIK